MSQDPSAPIPKPRGGYMPPLNIDRDAVKMCRVGGMSRQAVCAKFGIKLKTLLIWEARGAWPIPEAIAKAARSLQEGNKYQVASINEARSNSVVIESKAQELAQIGETNALLIAQHVAKLIAKSIKDDAIPPIEDVSSLATAFKIVEGATGRNKPLNAAVAVSVQVNPYQTGIVGNLQCGTITMENEPDSVAADWLDVAE